MSEHHRNLDTYGDGQDDAFDPTEDGDATPPFADDYDAPLPTTEEWQALSGIGGVAPSTASSTSFTTEQRRAALHKVAQGLAYLWNYHPKEFDLTGIDETDVQILQQLATELEAQPQ